MKINYFIAYTVIKDGAFGFGNLTLSHDRPLSSYDSIEEIQSLIKKKQNHSDDVAVLVINWKRFEDDNE